MRNQRKFSLEFKRQVVEEFLGGEGAAQLCHEYNICSSLLYHWKDISSRVRFKASPVLRPVSTSRFISARSLGVAGVASSHASSVTVRE
jgi:hypothetical protein